MPVGARVGCWCAQCPWVLTQHGRPHPPPLSLAQRLIDMTLHDLAPVPGLAGARRRRAEVRTESDLRPPRSGRRSPRSGRARHGRRSRAESSDLATCSWGACRVAPRALTTPEAAPGEVEQRSTEREGERATRIYCACCCQRSPGFTATTYCDGATARVWRAQPSRPALPRTAGGAAHWAGPCGRRRNGRPH
jgi:hypothetical protein